MKPRTAPIMVPAVPIKEDSNRKILMMNPSSAPIHFIVPISLKRSVTDISIAFVMPTRQTRSDSTTSQAFFDSSCRLAWLSGSMSMPFCCSVRLILALLAAFKLPTMLLLVQIDIRKAIASTMPLTVIRDRPNRILTLLKLISIAFDSGSLTCEPITSCRPADSFPSGIRSSSKHRSEIAQLSDLVYSPVARAACAGHICPFSVHL